MLIQQLVIGIAIGMIYGLFAVGYTLVFGVLRILNLAHAAIFMTGAMIAFYFVKFLGFNLGIALIISMIVCGFAGILLERIAFRPLRHRKASHLLPMITSIAVAVMIEAFFNGITAGAHQRFPASAFPSITIKLGTVSIDGVHLAICVVTIILTAILHLLLRETKMGKAIRAVAEDERRAGLLGIDVDRVISQTFFLSSAMGGATGIMIGLNTSAIYAYMGADIELQGLAIIILGGMGSIPGAVIGGLLIGMAQTFSIFHISSLWKDAIAFALLFITFMVRPSGIFGQKVGS